MGTIDRHGNLHQPEGPDGGQFATKGNSRPAARLGAKSRAIAFFGGVLAAMKRNRVRIALSAGAILTSGMLLAGCVASAPTGPTTPPPSPTSTSAPVTPEPVPTYTTAAGEEIPIPEDAPVPQAVLDDVGANVTGYARQYQAANSGADTPQSIGAVRRAVGDRDWILVGVSWAAFDPFSQPEWIWYVVANGDAVPGNPYHSQAEALAVADSWVAQQNDPGAWTMVVAQEPAS